MNKQVIFIWKNVMVALRTMETQGVCVGNLEETQS